MISTFRNDQEAL